MKANTTLTISKIIIFLAILYSCSNQSSWDKLGLNGEVKSYMEISYDAVKKYGEWENGEKDSGHIKSTFDEQGNLISTEFFHDENKLSYKQISKYEKGKVFEQSFYNKDGNLISKTSYKYNSSSVVEFESYNEKGEKLTKGKSIFKNNRVIKTTYVRYNNEEIEDEYNTIFEYDDGNLIMQKQTNKKGEIILFKRFEYLTFDKNKNWTKRLQYDSEEEDPVYITLREISYY